MLRWMKEIPEKVLWWMWAKWLLNTSQVGCDLPPTLNFSPKRTCSTTCCCYICEPCTLLIHQNMSLSLVLHLLVSIADKLFQYIHLWVIGRWLLWTTFVVCFVFPWSSKVQESYQLKWSCTNRPNAAEKTHVPNWHDNNGMKLHIVCTYHRLGDY